MEKRYIMVSEKIYNILSDLETITGIRIQLVENNIENQFQKYSQEFPSIMVSFMFNSFKQLSILEHLNNGFICHVSYQLGIENLYIPITTNTYLTIGPYSSTYLSANEIHHRLVEYNLPSTRAIYNFYTTRLPLIQLPQISSIKNLLCTALELKIDPENILFIREPKNKLSRSAFINNTELETQKKILLRYEKILSLTTAVSEGNYEKCTQILTTSFQYKIEKHYSPESLTNELVSTIYNGALFYSAVVKGGVSPEVADKLFTQYIHDLLTATSLDYIHKLSSDMLREFCNLVLQQQSDAHSPLIQQVINFLRLHTDVELAKEDLESAFRMSFIKLEKVFKNECGTTITKFHRTMRLKKAATLLENESISINQVAAQTGFLDQNYFSRIFKSVYGVTPSKYRTNFIRNMV